MSCDHDLANEWARCSGKNASYITNKVIDWLMPSIKKHNNRKTVRQWTAEGTTHRDSVGRNAPITAPENQPITVEHPACLKGDAKPVELIAWWRLAVCSWKVAIHITSDHIVRQTRILDYYCTSPRWTTTTLTTLMNFFILDFWNSEKLTMIHFRAGWSHCPFLEFPFRAVSWFCASW